MFLICNGILAFVAKSSKLTTSSGFEIMKNITEEDHHDHVKQIPEMPLLLKEAENAASMELYVDSPLNIVEENQMSLQQQEQEFAGFQKTREDEKTVGSPILNVEEKQMSLEQQQEQEFAGFQKRENEKTSTGEIIFDWEDEDEEEEELEEEAINGDAQVSTEELNKKFEEFIRRMKEEIRIEARRNTMIAAV
ncbi:hypothetical protein DH2020_033021 [Rehmannia glutinosa]|uniref:Uncharacterized protein n=1 Tax=Rehmannia glutinosa TaxID=99300 RepID=A0ABR0VFW6_REHGL